MNDIAIIMAGGSGTRFWPESRKSLPKQFLKVGDSVCLLEKTIQRLRLALPIENIFVVASMTHEDIITEYLPLDFLKSNVYLEPMAKNTAAAIATTIMSITKTYGAVNIGVFPSDHHISDVDDFVTTIKKAYTQSDSSGNIVTLGVLPTYPSVGYGYLKVSHTLSNDVYSLEKFVEKPGLSTAVKFIESGQYYWNAGIFFFSSDTMLNLFKILLPEIYYLTNELSDWHLDMASGKLNDIYEQLPSISIDYGIMEKTESIDMILLSSGWSDLGSWDSLDSVLDSDEDGNILVGDSLNLNTKNSVISSKNKLVVTIGLDALVIVETDDVLMVCDKDKVQDIKQMVAMLKNNNYDDYI